MVKINLKKEQIEVIVISVLVIVAIIIGIAKFRKKDKVVEMKDFTEKESIEKWEEVRLLEEQLPKEEVVISYVDVERIPFEGPFEDMDIDDAPVDDKVIVLPSMVLQGIIWSSIRPQIIINNIVYDVNDIIDIKGTDGEVKLRDIKRDGIYFEYKGEEFIVNPR